METRTCRSSTVSTARSAAHPRKARMAKKKPTKAEREHMDRVARLGCLICGATAEVHHVTTGVGMGQRASHYDTIPLCPRHHKATVGGLGEAIHAGKRTWEQRHGAELELLERTRTLFEEAA